MLVPIVVSESLAETYVERVTEADAGAHSELQIHDVHATHLGCGEVDRSPRLSLKSAQYVPTEEFDDGRQPDMMCPIQLVAWADSVKEDIPCESLGSGNGYSR